MTDVKQKHLLENLYIAISLICTAVYMCEIPGAVFFSPLLMFAAYIVYSLYAGRTIKYNLPTLLLLIFSVVYVFFIYKPNEPLYYQAYIYLHALFLFIIGYNFLNDKTIEERKKAIENFFLAVSLIYVVYILITFYHHFYMTAADLAPRFYYSIWYHSVKKPATVIAMCLVFPLIYGTYSLFYLPLPKKIIGTLFIVLTMFINIKTGTRTLVFLFPFLIAGEFLAWLIFKKKKTKAGLIILGGFVAVFAVAIILLVNNKAALAEKFSGYSFARYFGTDASSSYRIRYTMNVLTDFKLNYFGGGIHSESVGAPHNIWLYIYDWGGIIPFTVYMLFTVLIIVDFIRMFFNKNLSVDFKALLTTAVAVIFVEYMMEPFILPLPSFYLLCHFTLGLISCFAKTKALPDTEENTENTEHNVSA